jgi:molybdopterin-guanine dinucleotide biosynthesis protein A
MGRDKALIEIDGEPLVARVARRLAEVADPVFIAAGGRSYPVEHEHIEDAAPESGPLGGIVAALRRSPHPSLAVVAADMPFVSGAILSLLARSRGDEDVVIPEDAYGLQPLHAVYAKDALRKLEAALDEGRLSPTDLVGRLNHRIVRSEEWGLADPTGRFAFNINTEHDLDLM